jgi:hypothetical protein
MIAALLPLLAATLALGAPPAKKSTPASPASPPATKQLWRQWYLYTSGGQAAGYYEETAERRPGEKHLAVSQRWVEKEADGQRTETFIGSVSQDNPKLTPVAFFSERSGPARAYKLDGRAKGAQLELTYKPVTPPGANVRKVAALKGTTLLSNFVPLFLARRPAGGETRFEAVVEDARDGNFDVRPGAAEVFGVTRQVQGDSCRKAVVDFAGVAAEWWFTKEGKLCEISIPQNQAKLTMTTEADAKKALGL